MPFPVNVGVKTQPRKLAPNKTPTGCPRGTSPYIRVAIVPANSTTYANARSLITQRSQVQILPPQPIVQSRRLGKSDALPIRKSAAFRRSSWQG